MTGLQPRGSVVGPGPVVGVAPHASASPGEDEFIFASIEQDRFTDRTRLAVRDDNTSLVRRAHQMGQAAMHVVSLDPNWRKTMFGLQNRPLNPAQVDRLVGNFTVLRRHLPHDQLCVEMTPEDLEACLAFTVDYMRDRFKTPKHAHWYDDIGTLREQVTAKSRQYNFFADMPVLSWPPQRLPLPQLDRGQTRRAALIKKEGLDTGDEDLAIIDEENMQRCGWGICIANMDNTNEQYFNAVRINRPDVYAAASEGDNFSTAVKAWRSYSQQKRDQIIARGNEKGFSMWLRVELGIPSGQASRVKLILTNTVWRPIVEEWTDHAWGRTSFKLSAFTTAIAQHCDEIWEDVFSAQFAKLKEVFSDQSQRVTEFDLDLIKALGRPVSNKKLWNSKVRLLFYPCKEDVSKRHFPVDPQWFENQHIYLKYKLPVATLRNGVEYWFRRPEFLEALDHLQYDKAERFLEDANFRLPHPASLVRELEDLGEKLKQLNFFTVYFTQPTWAPKANAQKELEPFSFAQLIGNAYDPLPTVQDPRGELIEGAVSPVQYQIRKTRNRHNGRTFIRHLRLQLVTYMTAWRKAVPTITFDRAEARPIIEGATERRVFRDRFRNPEWNRFLGLVIERLGSRYFTGVMEPFHRHTGLLNNLRDGCPSVVDQSLRFFKDLRGHRYAEVPLLARSNPLAEGVAKSVDCLVCMLEYAECRRLRREYRDYGRTRQNGRQQSPEADAVPERPDAHKATHIATDADLEKYVLRSQQLAVRLAQFGWQVNPSNMCLDDELPFPNLGMDADLKTLQDFDSEYEPPVGAKATPTRPGRRRRTGVERFTGPRGSSDSHSDSSGANRGRKRRRKSLAAGRGRGKGVTARGPKLVAIDRSARVPGVTPTPTPSPGASSSSSSRISSPARPRRADREAEPVRRQLFPGGREPASPPPPARETSSLNDGPLSKTGHGPSRPSITQSPAIPRWENADGMTPTPRLGRRPPEEPYIQMSFKPLRVLTGSENESEKLRWQKQDEELLRLTSNYRPRSNPPPSEEEDALQPPTARPRPRSQFSLDENLGAGAAQPRTVASGANSSIGSNTPKGSSSQRRALQNLSKFSKEVKKNRTAKNGRNATKAPYQ